MKCEKCDGRVIEVSSEIDGFLGYICEGCGEFCPVRVVRKDD